MWDAYHEAAQAKLSNVRRVVDRFHVMKNLNEALSKTQRSIQNQANEDTKALLKGCRWLPFKNRENMTGEEREKPDKMLAASPELKTCYELKEGFRHWLIQHSDWHTDKVALQD
jgi:transposase